MDEAKDMIRRNDTDALREFMESNEWKPADPSKHEESKSEPPEGQDVSQFRWVSPYIAYTYVPRGFSDCQRKLTAAKTAAAAGNSTPEKINCLRDFMDDDGHTLLTFAAFANKRDCVRVLFEFDVVCCCDKADNHGKTALIYALENDNTSLALTLIESGCNVDARCGNWLRSVFQKHGDVRKPFFSALSYTANHCDARRVELLLKNGANPNTKGFYSNTALHDVKGNAEIAETLFRYGAQLDVLNKVESTPLHMASLRGEEDVVAFLVSKGVRLNCMDINQATPLHKAVSENRQGVARLLLTSGASIKSTDCKGMTALHHAAKDFNLGMVRVIVDVLQNVSSMESILPPYSIYSRYNKEKALEIAKVLLGASANVNDQHDMFAQKSTTALHRATLFDDVDYMQLLLDHGADPNLKDDVDQSPVDYATNDKNLELIDVLSRSKRVKIDALFFAIHTTFDEGVKLLIHNGVLPATVPFNTLSSKAPSYRLLGINTFFNVEGEPVSPLSYSIANGKPEMAEYLVSANYLTPYDVRGFLRSRTAHIVIGLDSLDDFNFQKSQELLQGLISSQPWSLVTLSFAAISFALGTQPGRAARVASLNLSYFLKQRLLFKDDALDKKGKGGTWAWQDGVFKRTETEIDIRSIRSLENEPVAQGPEPFSEEEMEPMSSEEL